MWIKVISEEINYVIRTVNARHDTNYEFLGRFDRGEWGAYRIAEPGKQPVVLKFFLNLSNTNIVDADPDLAKNITDRLLSVGYPVPKYIYSGSIGHGLYWVQQELPGRPLWKNPTIEQIEQILSFLLLQKNQAISEKQNSISHEFDVVARRRVSAEAILWQTKPKISWKLGDCFTSSRRDNDIWNL